MLKDVIQNDPYAADFRWWLILRYRFYNKDFMDYLETNWDTLFIKLLSP